MSSLVKKIKSINQWEKDLVIGYTKDAQKLVKPNEIPIAISYLCLIHYYEYDIFVCPEYKLKEMHINHKRDTIIVNNNHICSANVHGIMSISDDGIPAIYRWTFKLFNKGDETKNCTSIGICNETEPYKEYYRLFSDGEKD